jgi:hypothetical protein
MNKLVFETTHQILEPQLNSLPPYENKVDNIEEETIHKEDFNEPSKGNIKQVLIKQVKTPIISTRSKTLPRKNLCTFESFMNDNK